MEKLTVKMCLLVWIGSYILKLMIKNGDEMIILNSPLNHTITVWDTYKTLM